jgi:membrane associated rhomboid family serine protease
MIVLPIGDAPNPRGAAPVTYLLIALNVAVFLLVSLPLGGVRPDPRDPAVREYLQAMAEVVDEPVLQQLAREMSAYDLFVFAHGFRPAAPSLPDLVSSMFLHGGFLHLAGNMLFLWIYGDNVERRLGPMRFLAWYLATGVAATAVHALLSMGSPLPVVGASGAISGVLGFYFIWFPRNHVRLLWMLPPFFWQVFEVPARMVLGLYLVADNLLPLLLTRGEGGVAHGAHIGGFVAGLAAAWLQDRRGEQARPVGVAGPTGPAPDLRAALAEGRMAEAASAYFALPPAAVRGVLSPEEAAALAEWLRGAGHPDAALSVLRRTVRDVPRGPGLAEAHALAGRILLEDLHEPTAAYQYFLTALELRPSPAVAEAARRGLRAIEDLQKRRIGRLHTPHRW